MGSSSPNIKSFYKGQEIFKEGKCAFWFSPSGGMMRTVRVVCFRAMRENGFIFVKIAF